MGAQAASMVTAGLRQCPRLTHAGAGAIARRPGTGTGIPAQRTACPGTTPCQLPPPRSCSGRGLNLMGFPCTFQTEVPRHRSPCWGHHGPHRCHCSQPLGWGETLSAPAAKIRRRVEGTLPARALSRCSQLQAAPHKHPRGHCAPQNPGAVSHQSGDTTKQLPVPKQGARVRPSHCPHPRPRRRTEKAQHSLGDAAEFHCHRPHQLGQQRAPPRLPLAQAQDDGLPVLRSVVGNACGETQWPGWRCGREDRDASPSPSGTHSPICRLVPRPPSSCQ